MESLRALVNDEPEMGLVYIKTKSGDEFLAGTDLNASPFDETIKFQHPYSVMFMSENDYKMSPALLAFHCEATTMARTDIEVIGYPVRPYQTMMYNNALANFLEAKKNAAEKEAEQQFDYEIEDGENIDPELKERMKLHLVEGSDTEN
jgi:hypothetical protein